MERCPLHRVSSQISLFCFKNLFQGVRVQYNRLQSVSRGRGREEKEPKDNILEDIMFMIFWKPRVGKCLQCVKEPTNGVEENAVAMVRTTSHCKEDVVGHVSLIVSMFLSLPHHDLRVSLQLGNASTIELNTDWKSL